MIFRSLVLTVVFGLSIASAKSYSLTLDDGGKVGSLVLKPGRYKIAVTENSKVEFTDHNGNTVETTGRVIVSNGRKFSRTNAIFRKLDGGIVVDEIDLGGTRMKVEFP